MRMKLLLIGFILNSFFVNVFGQSIFIENDSIKIPGKDLSTVEKLDLSDLGLKSIPLNISLFTHLKELNLSVNSIQDLNPISELKDLEILLLDGSPNLKLSTLNITLTNLKQLKVLSIQSSKITFIPNGIFKLRKLEELHLNNNLIQTVSFEIRGMKSLRYLDLSENSIEFIDNGFSGLQLLEQLDLSGNGIKNSTHLFCQLAGLRNLKELSIDFDVSELVSVKGFVIESVRELRINNFDSFYENEMATYFTNLSSLKIRGDANEINFNKLLDQFSTSKLVSIYLYSNQLISVPFSITNYRELEYLGFEGSKFSSVPDFMNRFGSLKSVEVKANELDLFTSINNLIPVKSLEELSLTTRKSIQIPINISKLKGLTTLNIQSKELPKLPEGLPKLVNLREVVLNLDNATVSNLVHIDSLMPECKFTLNSYTLKQLKNGMSPPMAVIDVKFETFNVNANQESSIQTISGTRLQIPENAFLDENGKVVKGNVRIAYREFNDPIDMAFAGIPMIEREGDEVFTYASAGMLEFRAFQKNVELQANPNSTIQVDYASPFDGKEYDLFYLNPDNERWDNIGKDSIRPRSDEMTQNRQELDSLSSYPTPPRYLNLPYKQQEIKLLNYEVKRKNKMVRKLQKSRISVRVRSNQLRRIKRDTANKVYSELKYLDKFKWNLDFSEKEGMGAEEYRAFKEQMKNFDSYNQAPNFSMSLNVASRSDLNYITDFWLEPNVNRDNFNFVCSILGNEVRVPVIPSNLSNRPEVAQRRIKSFYKKYTKALNERKEDWAIIDEKFNLKMEEYYSMMGNYDEQMKKYNEELKKYNEISLNQLKTFAVTEGGVIRSFQLAGFGTFNCDVRYRMVNPKPLLANLENSDGEKLEISRLYILDKVNNGLLTFNGLSEAFFDDKSINCMIAILPNDRIGVLSSDQFNSINLGSKEYTAVLDIFDMKSMSINELRKHANFF